MNSPLPVMLCVVACSLLSTEARASDSSATGLSCRDFVPTEEAVERYPDLIGACEAVVERNGELYGQYTAEVRRVSRHSITLHLPATRHTFTLKPDASARALLDGKKSSFEDLVTGQKISIYLSVSQLARPDIEEIALITEEDLILEHPIGLAADGEEVVDGIPARITTSTVRSAAIIESVDVEGRELRLIDVSGNRFSVIADPAAGDLRYLRPRDRIITEYTESRAVLVVPPGTPELPQGGASAIAEEGLMDIEGIETQMLKARVASLNQKTRRATLVDEDGTVHNVLVPEDAPLELVEVGDELRIRITRAVAISIDRPEP